jgi:hypothetical protein
VDSEAEALVAADEVSETLSHFPALDVSVRPVADQEALAEQEQRQPHVLPVLHLAAPDGTTRCGSSLSAENTLLAPELFELSTERRCRRCMERLS